MSDNRDCPKVSFIVVTHNDERTITECLRSITNQDYPKIETIVVDANSHDSSVKVAMKYADKVIELRSNILGRSRQIGIDSSNGEYIAIMDADVALPRNWVSSAVSKMGEPGVGIVWSYNEPPLGSSVVARCFFSFWKEIMTHRIKRNGTVFAGSNSLYLKRAIDDVGGFNEASHYSEDVDLAFRIQKHGYKVAILDNPLVHDTMYSLVKYTRNQLWAAGDFSRQGLHRSHLSLSDIVYEHVYISGRGFVKGVFKERESSWLLFPILLAIRVYAYAIIFIKNRIDSLCHLESKNRTTAPSAFAQSETKKTSGKNVSVTAQARTMVQEQAAKRV